MRLGIVFLSEMLATVIAFERLAAFVDLQNVLGQVGSLAEGSPTGLEIAFKRLFSSVGAQMVEELLWIGNEAITCLVLTLILA